MKKKVVVSIVLLVVIVLMGFSGYNYVMHGGERNLSSETTDFSVSSKIITAEFAKNADVANKKYLEKAVAVSGTITAINVNEITIDNAVVCALKTADSSLKKGQAISVKGRVVGYDDLMAELKLDQCFSVKN